MITLEAQRESIETYHWKIMRNLAGWRYPRSESIDGEKFISKTKRDGLKHRLINQDDQRFAGKPTTNKLEKQQKNKARI